jgi:hypothetical protein
MTIFLFSLDSTCFEMGPYLRRDKGYDLRPTVSRPFRCLAMAISSGSIKPTLSHYVVIFMFKCSLLNFE